MESEPFKDRLKTVMKGESNLSFAKKCGVSESAIRNYLKGQTTPDLDTLAKIAEMGGCSLAWLASGEETAKPQQQPLDEDTLIAVLEVVEEYLDDTNSHLPPAKKGQLISMMYEMCINSDEKKIDKAKVIRLVKLAA